MDPVHHLSEYVQAFLHSLGERVEAKGRDSDVAVATDPLPDHGLASEQSRPQDHLFWNAARSFLPLALQPQLLDLVARLLETRATVGFEIEVRLGGAHRAQGKRQSRAARLHQDLEIVADGHDPTGTQIQLGEFSPDALGAPAQMREMRLAGFGHERSAEPTVGELTGQFQPSRRDGGEVDGNVVGPEGQANRFPFAARQRKLVVLAVEGDFLSSQSLANDLDVLAQPLHRLREGNAVETLHHLGPAGAQAEQEAPLAEL